MRTLPLFLLLALAPVGCGGDETSIEYEGAAAETACDPASGDCCVEAEKKTLENDGSSPSEHIECALIDTTK